MDFIRKALTSYSGEASTKRLLFFFAVATMCIALGVIVGILIGLSIVIPPDVVVLREYIGMFEMVSGMVLAATTTGYVGGKIAENTNKEQD